MKKFYEKFNYKQWIKFNCLRSNIIIEDWSCTCADFTYRHLKKTMSGKTKTNGMCKHIKQIIKDEKINRKKEKSIKGVRKS